MATSAHHRRESEVGMMVTFFRQQQLNDSNSQKAADVK
jgi:hypothetical protein